jgi:multidrug efflux system membrane fusion protein
MNLHQFSQRWRLMLLVVAIALIVAYCSSPAKKQKPTGLPVVLAQAKLKDVPVYLMGLGTVTPDQTITVRTQVNGQLLKVLFVEGQMVKKGDLLAEVDPRPYHALLMQYQGQLARDEALLNNANIDLQRYQKLWKLNSVSKQTLDTQASLVKQNEGTIAIDKGLIASTQLSLLYTKIVAPVSGLIGLSLVDEGNYVQTSDANGLAVINTIDPISVISTVAEDAIPELAAELKMHKTLTALAYDRTQTNVLATGKLMTLDNQIDPTTGTVKLRSDFPNPNATLFPNQFVNLSVLVKTIKDAVVVPTTAIAHGAKGDYIFVVDSAPSEQSKKTTTKKDTMTVKSVPVIVGEVAGEDSAILKGINVGDQVVVEGADKLTDGAAVHIAGSVPVVSA